MKLNELTTEAQQYIETALWSSSIADAADIDPDALVSMSADVASFMADPELADALEYWRAELGDGQAGHDFWLTRNHHGAGFWDRFAAGDGDGERYGRILTDAAHACGSSDLYIGDDGKVHAS